MRSQDCLVRGLTLMVLMTATEGLQLQPKSYPPPKVYRTEEGNVIAIGQDKNFAYIPVQDGNAHLRLPVELQYALKIAPTSAKYLQRKLPINLHPQFGYFYPPGNNFHHHLQQVQQQQHHHLKPRPPLANVPLASHNQPFVFFWTAPLHPVIPIDHFYYHSSLYPKPLTKNIAVHSDNEMNEEITKQADLLLR